MTDSLRFIPFYVAVGFSALSFFCTCLCFLCGWVYGVIWIGQFARFQFRVSKRYPGIVLPIIPLTPSDFRRCFPVDMIKWWNPLQLLREEQAMEFLGLTELTKTNTVQRRIDPQQLNTDVQRLMGRWKAYIFFFTKFFPLLLITGVLFVVTAFVAASYGAPASLW